MPPLFRSLGTGFCLGAVLTVCFSVLFPLGAGTTAFAGQSPSPARHGKLFVNWRDATTDKPVAHAKIEIYPANGGRGFSIETDKKGLGAHLMLKEGFYTVIFTKKGYAPVEVTEVYIEEFQPARIDLKSLDAELAPYKKKQVRYEKPTLDTEGNGMRMVIRQ